MAVRLEAGWTRCPKSGHSPLVAAVLRISRNVTAVLRERDRWRDAAVDYLQLLTVAERRQNRTEAVGELSRGLKLLAMELGVPVIALSQLSREAVAFRPSLAHLRESGSLEQDADVAILLYESEGHPTECIVAKNRNGATGSVWLEFDKARASLTESTQPIPDDPPSTGFPRKRGFSE